MALSTKNPSLIHCTKIVPIWGMLDRRLVITVASQSNNCKMQFMEVICVSNNREATQISQVSLQS